MTNTKLPVLLGLLLSTLFCGREAEAAALKTHRIFSSNMVIQRDKPIMIWGWAEAGQTVAVQFGEQKAEATAAGEQGRWEVKFPAQGANTTGQKLIVKSNDKTIELDNILIGDVWVMNGQSNMALALSNVNDGDFEIAQANLPLLRQIRITPNESYELQTDLPDAVVEGWNVCTPKTAGGMSGIGYAFASRVQRATGIPIGIIDNARGGASIESLVPRHKFADHPLTARYAESVETRRKEFDWDAAVSNLSVQWEKEAAKARQKGTPENKLPPKPVLARETLRSWNVPGKSPSDAAACYNGMFGVFKGLNIRGVLFHQGYNNQFDCRPERYRLLMKQMIEGWREDFNDPTLPVAVIAGCGNGGEVQSSENFELLSVSQPTFLREAQQRGLNDVADPAHTVFLPDYDIQSPGFHPKKKVAYGFRAARWALSTIYGFGKQIEWETAPKISTAAQSDVMVVTFDKPVRPDDMGLAIEGFSIAGADGKYYMAHAAYQSVAKKPDFTKIHVWSPLVKEPVAIRYAWASSSPLGNLKVNGKEWLPLPTFRTDTWNWPESEDPAEKLWEGAKQKEAKEDSLARHEFRKREEAKLAVEILERLKTLGIMEPEAKK